MWANAQRHGCPAEYRWCPLFNAAVWLTPTTRVPCSNTAKTRNPLKFAGVPQSCQRISATTEQKFTILWGHVGEILLFNNFFPMVDTCLSCEDIARQCCAMVPRWAIFGDFLWSPYVIGQAIVFLPCRFYLLSSLISSPNLSGRRLNVYHTSTHGVALVWIWNACLKCAARSSLKIQDAKNCHFGTIAQLCRFFAAEACINNRKKTC